MKTVYICSEYFAPYQNIGSIKFTKIAKFLSRNPEYRIIIFSRKNFANKIDYLLQEDLHEIEQNGGRIFYIDSGWKYCQAPRRLYGRLYGIWYKLTGYDINYYFSNTYAAKKFCRGALETVKRHHLPRPDVIISTYDDWGSHYFALSLKRRLGDKVKWISDFRDPVGSAIKKGIFRKLCDRYSNLVTKESDYTTAISEGVLNVIKVFQKSNTKVVSLGFDHEDYEKVAEDCKKFHLIYTGSFYGKLRTLVPVFRAVRELIDEGKVEEKFIAIEYAGECGTMLYNEVCRFGLERSWIDWGSVNRYQSILIQERSDVLLTAVWNAIDFQGIMGGKTLGYLMLNKPIIAVVGGDLGDSDMKKFVKETNCGICYEEANHSKDYNRLKEWILKYYTQKRAEGKVTQEYNKDVERYNYINISKQYENIMKNCLAMSNKKNSVGFNEKKL